MKKNIFTKLSGKLVSKAVLALSGGLLLVSCGAHVGGYSETDGVYYDPNTDTLPEGVIVQSERNRVGEYYDYNEGGVIANSKQHQYEQENKYSQWNSTDSDWGAYAGNETNFYNDYWGGYWGSPWGYYSPFWGSGFGMGLNWGWGSWHGYSPYMSWGWGGYHPYMFGYSPFWGYYSPYSFGYNPYYYGYNPYYYGSYYPYRYQRSGTVGRGFNSYMNNGSPFQNKTGNVNGFRNGTATQNPSSVRGFGNQTPNTQSGTIAPRPRYRNPNVDTQPQSRPRTPNYDMQQSRPSNGGFRNDGGFRGNNGSFNSGSSGGGFRGSSTTGSRSGGFR